MSDDLRSLILEAKKQWGSKIVREHIIALLEEDHKLKKTTTSVVRRKSPNMSLSLVSKTRKASSKIQEAMET